METWEKKLEEVLAKKNVYSFSDSNHQLIKWLKEWTNIIRNKDGMYAMYGNCGSSIEIKAGEYNSPYFIGSLFYMKDENTDQFILRFVYADSFNKNKKIRDIFNNVEKEESNYYSMIQEDIHLYEEKILEKEFVLSYLTLKFQNFEIKM
jgi:lipopolysaccharide export LptBFGC system permease protein LptF